MSFGRADGVGRADQLRGQNRLAGINPHPAAFALDLFQLGQRAGRQVVLGPFLES